MGRICEVSSATVGRAERVNTIFCFLVHQHKATGMKTKHYYYYYYYYCYVKVMFAHSYSENSQERANESNIL